MEWPSFASSTSNWPTWAALPFDELLRESYFTDSGDMRVASQNCVVIQVLGYKGTADNNQVVLKVDEVDRAQLVDKLKIVPQEAGERPLWGLTIILSFRKKEEIDEYFEQPGEEFDYPSADTPVGLCFSRKAFEDLKLSETFLQMLHSNRGIPLSVRSDGRLAVEQTSQVGYNLRTEESLPKDLALSLSSNLSSGLTSAFVHGSCVAEIQFRRHRTVQGKYHDRFSQSYDDVQQLALRLSHHYSDSTSAEQSKESGKIGNFIGRVFSMYEKAGSLHAQMTAFQAQLKVMMDSLDRIRDAVPEDRRKQIDSHGEAIRERLQSINFDYDNLIQQNTTTIDGASLLLTSIWSLVGQKDNQLNQDIANSSRIIAMESRRDSSAMKALAVLTVFFLPATTTAAIFAMPVFEWDANPSWPGVSTGFWVYWVVTVTLTAFVLYIWGYWFIGAVQHQRKNDAKFAKGEEFTKASKLQHLLLRDRPQLRTRSKAASA